MTYKIKLRYFKHVDSQVEATHLNIQRGTSEPNVKEPHWSRHDLLNVTSI